MIHAGVFCFQGGHVQGVCYCQTECFTDAPSPDIFFWCLGVPPQVIPSYYCARIFFKFLDEITSWTKHYPLKFRNTHRGPWIIILRNIHPVVVRRCGGVRRRHCAAVCKGVLRCVEVTCAVCTVYWLTLCCAAVCGCVRCAYLICRCRKGRLQLGVLKVLNLDDREQRVL
jgi:hypothetical protein